MLSEELVGITGFKRNANQAEWLRENGFQFKLRADGSVLISRRHFEFVMGGIEDRMFIGYPEPDFDSLN
jgi:hypothetical protein